MQGRKVSPVLLPLLSGTQVLNFTSNFCYLILQPLQKKKIFFSLVGSREQVKHMSINFPRRGVERDNQRKQHAKHLYLQKKEKKNQMRCIKQREAESLLVCKSGGLLLHKYSHQSKQFNKERKVTLQPLQIMVHMQHCVCSLNYKVIAAPISQKVW